MKNNNYIYYAAYLRNSVAYDHDLVHLCKMMIFPGVIFIFFQILIF